MKVMDGSNGGVSFLWRWKWRSGEIVLVFAENDFHNVKKEVVLKMGGYFDRVKLDQFLWSGRDCVGRWW